jgi:hypothetical protein
MSLKFTNVPLSFEFRTAKVQWTQDRARVIGWSRLSDSERDRGYLIAALGRNKSIGTIKHRLDLLPADLRRSCLKTFDRKNPDEAVADVCADFQLTVFTTKALAEFDDDKMVKRTLPSDAWWLRSEFLKVKPNPEAFLSFLNKWGRWHTLRRYVELPALGELQEAVRDALNGEHEKWFASRYAVSIVANARYTKYPFMGIRTDSAQSALCIATTLDLLRKAKFTTCTRENCRLSFEVTSNHKRLFCSYDCAHAETMRRKRASDREQKRQTSIPASA